jgi:hypothetical protein
MAWWSVPLVAFVVAVIWVTVANRPRPPADPHESMAEHERFRQAMGRPVDDVVHGAKRRPPADGNPPGDPLGPEPGDGRPASA